MSEAAGPARAGAFIQVEETVARELRAQIEEELRADGGRAGRLAGWRIVFVAHDRPEDPLVLLWTPGGTRETFYLHEARERARRAALSWRRPWTWLPRWAGPGAMDVRAQTRGVLEYALAAARGRA